MIPGTKVRMSNLLKEKLRKNGSAEHVNEFGNSIKQTQSPQEWLP